MSIYKKLQQARADLHSQKLQKTGNNNKKPFFELGDFLPQAIAIFNKIGLCGVVSFTQEEATLEIHDCDSEAVITIRSPFGSAALPGCHPVQNIGAVETYQRRYLWMTALDIIEHDGIETAGAPAEKIDEKEMLARIELVKTIDELRALRGTLQAECKTAGDQAAWAVANKATMKRKEEIEAAAASDFVNDMNAAEAGK